MSPAFSGVTRIPLCDPRQAGLGPSLQSLPMPSDSPQTCHPMTWLLERLWGNKTQKSPK